MSGKLTEELKLEVSIDSAKATADAKVLNSLINRTVKEIRKITQTLDKSFELLSENDVKEFKGRIDQVTNIISTAQAAIKKGNLSVINKDTLNLELKSFKDYFGAVIQGFKSVEVEKAAIEKRDAERQKKSEEAMKRYAELNAKQFDSMSKKSKEFRNAEREKYESLWGVTSPNYKGADFDKQKKAEEERKRAYVRSINDQIEYAKKIENLEKEHQKNSIDSMKMYVTAIESLRAQVVNPNKDWRNSKQNTYETLFGINSNNYKNSDQYKKDLAERARIEAEKNKVDSDFVQKKLDENARKKQEQRLRDEERQYNYVKKSLSADNAKRSSMTSSIGGYKDAISGIEGKVLKNLDILPDSKVDEILRNSEKIKAIIKQFESNVSKYKFELVDVNKLKKEVKAFNESTNSIISEAKKLSNEASAREKERVATEKKKKDDIYKLQKTVITVQRAIAKANKDINIVAEVIPDDDLNHFRSNASKMQGIIDNIQSKINKGEGLDLIDTKEIDLQVQHFKDKSKQVVDQYAKAARDAKKERDKADRDANRQSKDRSTFGRIKNAAGVLSVFSAGSLLAKPVFKGVEFLSRTIDDVVAGSAQYSREMAKVRAITGATTNDMSLFSSSIMDIGNKFGFTAQQGTEAILMISRLGVAARDIPNVLNSTAAFATATGSSLEKTAELLVNTMNAFDISFDKSKAVTDQMTATLNASALDVDKYSTILGYVGAAANENNVTFEQTNAMLTLLSKNGLKASTAGTSLRSIFGALAKDGRDLNEVLKELKDSNMSYVEAIGLVEKRAANALTILVKNSDKIKETSQYIRLSILNSEEQANLIAQISLVERLTRTWEGALTSVKAYIGGLFNEDTEGFLERSINKAKASFTEDAMYNGVVSQGTKDELKATMKILINEWIKGLTDEDKAKYKFNVSDQKELQANLAKEFSRVISERTGGFFDNVAYNSNQIGSDIANDVIKKSRQPLMDQIYSEVYRDLENARRRDEFKPANGKTSEQIEKDYLDKIIKEKEKQYNAEVKFTKDQIENFKNSSVRRDNTYKKGEALFNKYTKEANELFARKESWTVTDNIKYEELRGNAKAIDDYWHITDKTKKKTTKQTISISDISSLVRSQSVQPEVQAMIDELDVLSKTYRKAMEGSTSEEESKRIAEEYLKVSRDVYDKINGDGILELIQSRTKDVGELRSLIDEADTAKRKELLDKYDNNTSSVAYRLDLKNWANSVAKVRTEIDSYNVSMVDILTDSRSKAESVLNGVVGIRKFTESTVDFQQTENMMMLSNEIADELSRYSTALARGDFKGRRRIDKKALRKNISDFDAANNAAYTSRTGKLLSYKMKIDKDRRLIESDNLTREQNDYLRIEYGTNDRNEIRKKLDAKDEKYKRESLSSKSLYESGLKSSATSKKTLTDTELEEKQIRNQFFSDTAVDAMDLMVNYYQSAQEQMLEASRQRVEAEIEAERERIDRINGMNASAVELGLMSQQDYAMQKEQLEREAYEKENALMKDQFEREKKLEVKMAALKLTQSMAQIALNVAVAESSKGLVGILTVPGTIAAFSAIAAAQSAVEIAAINKKEYVPKKFADGGLVFGNSHSNGGVPFTVAGRSGYEMEGGEFIVKKREVQKNLSTLKAINNGTFQSSSHYYNNDALSAKIDELINATSKPMRAYVTSGDLEKNQRARVIVSNKTQL